MEEHTFNESTYTLTERQFFALLRVSLGLPIDNCLLICKIDWDELYKLAQKHALVGILFHGIESLPKERLPEMDLFMEWLGQTEYIKSQNDFVNRKADELTKTLAEDGFRSVVLKGQANACYYLQPDLRTPGDIDIWIEGGDDKVLQYVSKKYGLVHSELHHTECNIFRELEVEAHFSPTMIFSPFADRRLQQLFQEYSDRCFDNMIQTADGRKFCVLDFQSNVLMQLAHMYRHLLCGGVGLRQVVDYYCLLKSGYNGKYDKWFEPQQRLEISQRIKEVGLGKFASAVSYILKSIFYMDEEYLLISANENEGMFLLSEIMIGGNFGQHDTRYNNKYKEHKIRNFLYRTYQNFHLMKHYPTDCFWVTVYRVRQNLWRWKNGYK